MEELDNFLYLNSLGISGVMMATEIDSIYKCQGTTIYIIENISDNAVGLIYNSENVEDVNCGLLNNRFKFSNYQKLDENWSFWAGQ